MRKYCYKKWLNFLIYGIPSRPTQIKICLVKLINLRSKAYANRSKAIGDERR